jgi:thiamine biosynthesis lipoprotein
MRQVRMIMGMPVIIDIPAAHSPAIFIEVFDYLHTIDEKFSTYRQDSEVSMFNRNELTQDELSAEVKYVYDQCTITTKKTKGYFNAHYADSFDPSGYVKAWAMAHVATMITQCGYSTYLVNIAGDMIAAGDEKVWTIAIQDPWHNDNSLGVVALYNQTIATSGTYQRGDHIINPFTKNADTDLISVSIYGRNIITADVYATTCIAMGSEQALAFMSRHSSYAAYLIKKDGTHIVLNDFQLAKMQTAQ